MKILHVASICSIASLCMWMYFICTNLTWKWKSMVFLLPFLPCTSHICCGWELLRLLFYVNRPLGRCAAEDKRQAIFIVCIREYANSFCKHWMVNMQLWLFHYVFPTLVTPDLLKSFTHTRQHLSTQYTMLIGTVEFIQADANLFA